MNEQEWLECDDPASMLKFLHDGFSDRKLRLFACACYRRVFHLLNETNPNQATIEFAERYADGLATKNELHGNAWGKPGEVRGAVQWKAIDAAENSAEHSNGVVEDVVRKLNPETYKAWQLAFELACDDFRLGEAVQVADGAMPSDWVDAGREARAQERHKQSDLLRDIFGNPFRPVAIEPAWLTTRVTALAQVIYDERRFAEMPLLADALEEAGCANADILNHCRQPGEHVRGCWVVDLLLGKA